MEPLKDTLTKHIRDIERFCLNPTPEDILNGVLGNIPHPNKIIVDGVYFKERGCSGPCACTGNCRQLVPYTELDESCNAFYESQKEILLPMIKEIINE